MSSKAENKPAATSHLKDLILLFSIPLAIAILAAAIIYIPRWMAHPTYDFIYSVCQDYRCKNSYVVDSAGHVTQESNKSASQPEYPEYYDSTAILRYYDASEDVTRSMSFEEAKKYVLDTSSRAPDGYTLVQEDSRGSFLFWGGYDEGWYLKKGLKKKPVELSGTSYLNQNNFLGWVKK